MTALAYRLLGEADRPFVLDSWLSSFADAHAAGVIPLHMYRRVYHEVVEWILARPGIEVQVAYHPDEDDRTADLYGWLCHERGLEAPVIHYIFVKQAFRRMGIGRGLVAAAGIKANEPLVYTFKQGVVTEILKRGPWIAKWNPMIARYPRHEFRAVEKR